MGSQSVAASQLLTFSVLRDGEGEVDVTELEKIELMVETIQWYANAHHYEESAPGKGEIDGEIAIVTDSGVRARNVLKLLRDEKWLAASGASGR